MGSCVRASVARVDFIFYPLLLWCKSFAECMFNNSCCWKDTSSMGGLSTEMKFFKLMARWDESSWLFKSLNDANKNLCSTVAARSANKAKEALPTIFVY